MQQAFVAAIPFSCNWNNKLHCHYFTTIRLSNDRLYQVGRVYQIKLHGQIVYEAILLQLKQCKLQELPEITCYIDTGYNKQQTIDMFKKMYQPKNIDWDKQLLSVMLFENLSFHTKK